MAATPGIATLKTPQLFGPNAVTEERANNTLRQVERLKGLQLKFTAFYKLLLECPHLADRIVLLQLGISVHEREQDYHKCLTELRKLAAKINSEFAPSPDKPVLVLEVTSQQCFVEFFLVSAIASYRIWLVLEVASQCFV